MRHAVLPAESALREGEQVRHSCRKGSGRQRRVRKTTMSRDKMLRARGERHGMRVHRQNRTRNG